MQRTTLALRLPAWKHRSTRRFAERGPMTIAASSLESGQRSVRETRSPPQCVRISLCRIGTLPDLVAVEDPKRAGFSMESPLAGKVGHHRVVLQVSAVTIIDSDGQPCAARD